MNQRYSDREILDLFRDENTRRKAFTLLANKYQQKIYWMIRRMVVDHDDTDDVLQNTLIKIWKGLPFFREDSKLFSWIYRIAYNESVSFLKSKKHDLGLSANSFCDHMENIIDENKSISCEEIEARLQKAILCLPEKQRMVFHLRYYDEMPYEEMSEVFGTSVGSLKASFHLAVKKIEKNMLDD